MTLVHKVLFVAWRSPRTRGIYPVARLLLRDEEPAWELCYIDGARQAALVGFAPFIEFDDLHSLYVSRELFPLFKNRLMPDSRPDYDDYLVRLGFGGEHAAPVPILARSAGRRLTDKIEVFGLPSFDPVRSVFTYLFFLRGVRHVEGAEELIAGVREGEKLACERDNPIDQLAVTVSREHGGRIGWVPACLVEDLERLMDGGSVIEVFAHKRNLPPAPVHERVLCRLEASAIPGFAPFSTATYRPIPSGATELSFDAAELLA